VTTLKMQLIIHNPELNRLCATHFFTRLWISTHTLGMGTTGIDQPTNRCVKLQ